MAKFIYYVNNTYKEKMYIRPHYHRNYEIVYSVCGKLSTKYVNGIPSNIVKKLGPTLFVNEILDSNLIKVELKEHSFIIYPPFYTHDEYHKMEGEIVAINFSLDNEEGIIPLITSINEDKEIENIINKITIEMNEKKTNYLQMVNAYLTMIVALVKRKYSSNDENVDFLDQIVKQIDDYFATTIDFDSLADSYGYNSDYLRTLFKKKTGLSPKNYIQQKRIELAMRQIKETELPLKTIANNCGYDDYLQFTSYFKKKTGLSPIEYRKTK